MWHSCQFLTQFVVFLYFTVPGIISQDTCNDFKVRLFDNTRVSNTQGQVEVCLDGTWGRVCDDGWDVNDATTVCTQLGHNVTGIPTRRSFFGEVSGPIHLTNARCRSNDTRLRDCNIDRTGVNNSCGQSEQAGVVCLQGQQCTKDGEVRLLGGENEREGRVEFCFNGFWWEVCDHGWDEVDAKVVCSQLGYGNTSAVVMNTFGTRSLLVLLRNVNCNLSHTELSQCVSPEEIFAVHGELSSCGTDNRAGVKCVNSSNSVTTTRPATNGEGSSSAVSGAVIGAVIGVLAAVIIVIVIVVIVVVVVVVTKRREKSKEPLGQEKTNNFGMKENEAYGTAQQRNVVVTQQNEAYGTAQQRNVVVTQQNEAYGTAQQRNVVLTQQNEAYGTLEEDYVTVV